MLSLNNDQETWLLGWIVNYGRIASDGLPMMQRKMHWTIELHPARDRKSKLRRMLPFSRIHSPVDNISDRFWRPHKLVQVPSATVYNNIAPQWPHRTLTEYSKITPQWLHNTFTKYSNIAPQWLHNTLTEYSNIAPQWRISMHNQCKHVWPELHNTYND